MGSPSLADRLREWLWPLVYRIWRDTIEALVTERSVVARVHHGDSEAYYRAYNAGYDDAAHPVPELGRTIGALSDDPPDPEGS